MPDTTVVIADEYDLNEILNLQKDAYQQEAEIYNNFEIPPLTQTIDSLREDWQNGVILKATKSEEIVGSVRAILNDNICKIGRLIVKPNFQNQGIGKLLMQNIEKAFSESHVFELFTGDKSEKNLSLYRRLGYIDVKTEQISNNLSLIYLQKTNKSYIDCE